MDLGKLGVWYFTDQMPAPELVALSQRIERWGYGALWVPEAVGRDPFALSAAVLAQTESLVLATGIANIYARDPNAMAAAQKTVAEQSGGRFLLGLGVSHAPMVEGLRGHAYGKPVATMRAYLERMGQAPYAGAPPPDDLPIVLAALGPRMLALSAEQTQGAHPYNTDPEHTRRAREIMGPDAWLCVEQKVVFEPDVAQARQVAIAGLQMYKPLPNYRNNWKRLGYSEEEIESDSDRFIDGIVACGGEDIVRGRIQAHLDAGASHVCIQPLNPAGGPGPDERILEILAPAGG